MSRVVFLLEEYSARILLEGLLPRLFPDLRFLCVHHEGKRDLERSVPRKLRDVLVRLACQELEAWYLGEPDALATEGVERIVSSVT